MVLAQGRTQKAKKCGLGLANVGSVLLVHGTTWTCQSNETDKDLSYRDSQQTGFEHAKDAADAQQRIGKKALMKFKKSKNIDFEARQATSKRQVK